MAKITRKTARIFGSSALAAPNGVSQFGSLAAGSPAYSLDPDVIQALAEWLGGWNTALVGGASPALEDMNAINFVNSYMVAYLLQQGIPEWDTNTTYYQDSYVSYNSTVWRSLTNDNVGNTPGSTADWATFNSVTPLVANTGTGDAIALSISNFSGLVNGQLLPFFTSLENTSTTVTVSINGGTPIPVVTADNSASVPVGAIIGTMLMVFDGTSLRTFDVTPQINGFGISANQNNYNPSGYTAKTRVIELTPSANVDITGLVPHQWNKPITVHLSLNSGAFQVTLKHNDAASAVGNRFFLPNSADLVLSINQSVELISSFGSYWIVNAIGKA